MSVQLVQQHLDQLGVEQSDLGRSISTRSTCAVPHRTSTASTRTPTAGRTWLGAANNKFKSTLTRVGSAVGLGQE